MVKFAYIKIYIYIFVLRSLYWKIFCIYFSLPKGAYCLYIVSNSTKRILTYISKVLLQIGVDGTSFIEDILVCSVLEVKSGLIALLVSEH